MSYDLTQQRFRALCDAHGFPDDVDPPHEAAAIEFANQQLGIWFATVQIPSGTSNADAGAALLALARFATP